MEQANQGGGYHDRIKVAATELADVLMEQGVEAALDAARVSAESFSHGHEYLMSQATGQLFASRDEARMNAGLTYLQWVAEQEPSLEVADNIAYNAEYDAREEGFGWFAGRSFDIAMTHIRGIAGKEDFVPGVAFVEVLKATIDRMEMSGFGALAREVLIEFTSQIIEAGSNRPDEEVLEKHELADINFTLDSALSHVALNLRDSHPEVAREARSLISNDREKESLTALSMDGDITKAFLLGDFETARALISVSGDSLYVSQLWSAMQNRLIRNEDQATLEWGNQVIDCFSGDFYTLFGKSNVAAMFNGRSIGKVAGMLGRTDLLDAVLESAEDTIIKMIIISETAWGAGYKDRSDMNQEVFRRAEALGEEALTKVPEFIEQLSKSFENGQSDRVEIASQTQELNSALFG